METEQISMRSASLAEARRHESAGRWVAASRAYLNALTTQAELREISLAGLKRCASREKSQSSGEPLQTSVALYLIGHTLTGNWAEAVKSASELWPSAERSPKHLSPSIELRWHNLSQRLFFVIEQESDELAQLSWVAVLYVLETLVEHQYVGDAMMMSREVLSEISQELHQALICFEAGRIGIKYHQSLSGSLLLTEAAQLAPNLRGDIDQLIDHELSTWMSSLSQGKLNEGADLIERLNQQDRYDELIALRTKELSTGELQMWVNELCLGELDRSAPYRAQSSLWLGLCLERLWRSRGSGDLGLASSVFLAFAIVLEQASQRSVPYDHAFSRLLHLSLSRRIPLNHDEGTTPSTPVEELEDDESTFDSRRSEPLQKSEELIEEGEARLLIQLKEQKRYDLVLVFLKEKASSPHLTDRERAKAYNALAQVSLTTKGGLKQAVMYAQLGAALDPNEIKLSTLIKSARDENDWSALEPLLKIQLNLTRVLGKRAMILKTIAQGQRQSGLWLSAYLTLIQAGSEEPKDVEQLSHVDDVEVTDSHTAPDQVNPFLLTFSDETEREITSLLKVKGSALTIGEELISQSRWDELYRLLERLLMKGRVCADLLIRAVNEASDNWKFSEALLNLYSEEQQWEEWFNLFLYAPKHTWPNESLSQLISDGVKRANELASPHRSELMKAYAEHLAEVEAPPLEHIKAWVDYLGEHPADLGAIERLEPYAMEAKQWDTLIDVYEAALPLRKTGKVRILERLFVLYKDHQEDIERAVEIQKMILGLDPSNETAGAWLTLHFAAKHEWYEVLLICALWTPSTSSHPVWTESKVRAHLGLSELSEAHYWWSQLSQKSVKRLFIKPLLILAAEEAHGELVLELIESFKASSMLISNEMELSDEELFGVDRDDTPPPLPVTNFFEDEIIGEVDGDEALVPIDALSPDQIERLRARALYLWLNPSDLIEAVHTWEAISRQEGNDTEVIYALVDLYGRLGRKKHLIEQLAFVERGAEEVLANREALILGALTLETRFQEYTEAFKCWLALYEHSHHDRERCLTAFWRLSSHDEELSLLVHELLKLRAEHSQSRVLAFSTLLELACLDLPRQSSRTQAYRAMGALIHDSHYGVEALNQMLRLTVPLGTWLDTCRALKNSKHWRLLLLAAHLTECKLGDHLSAFELYHKTDEALKTRYHNEELPLYLAGVDQHIQAALKRLEPRKGKIKKRPKKKNPKIPIEFSSESEHHSTQNERSSKGSIDAHQDQDSTPHHDVLSLSTDPPPLPVVDEASLSDIANTHVGLDTRDSLKESPELVVNIKHEDSSDDSSDNSSDNSNDNSNEDSEREAKKI